VVGHGNRSTGCILDAVLGAAGELAKLVGER